MPLSIQQIPNMSRDELTLILAGGLVGVGVSGAGALSKNEINNQTLSHIVDSTIAIAGNLKVTAEDTAKIDGKIIAASVAAAGGAVGVGVALGLSYVENIIPATALTQAKISGGQFTVGGSVTVDASSTGTMNSDVNAVSIGFAAGAAGVAAAVAEVMPRRYRRPLPALLRVPRGPLSPSRRPRRRS